MDSHLLDHDLLDDIRNTFFPVCADAMSNHSPAYDAGSVHYPDDNRLREQWIQGHVIIRTELDYCPRLYELFPTFMQIAVSMLVRDGYLAPHRDAKVLGMARYHVPLLTDTSALWWDESNGVVRMMEGYMYGPVPYENLHMAVGSHNIYRCHLLLDVAETS